MSSSKKAVAAGQRAYRGTKSLDEANLPNLFCQTRSMTRKILSPANGVALIPFTLGILVVLQHVEKNNEYLT
jgi:hypothetical protein